MHSENGIPALTHHLGVRVSDSQRDWLRAAGAREQPRVDASGMLERLVERAMTDGELEATRREHQLEVYRASGYSEHHPDYPNLPEGLSDVRE